MTKPRKQNGVRSHENIYLHIKKLYLYKILVGIPLFYLLMAFCWSIDGIFTYLQDNQPMWAGIGVAIIMCLFAILFVIAIITTIITTEKDWGIKK